MVSQGLAQAFLFSEDRRGGPLTEGLEGQNFIAPSCLGGRELQPINCPNFRNLYVTIKVIGITAGGFLGHSANQFSRAETMYISIFILFI